MADDFQIVIGSWYRDQGNEIFEVVAVDDDEGTIDVQYANGQVEEIDIETWHELSLVEIEPPDGSGDYGEAAPQDGAFSDEERAGRQDPLQRLESLIDE